MSAAVCRSVCLAVCLSLTKCGSAILCVWLCVRSLKMVPSPSNNNFFTQQNSSTVICYFFIKFFAPTKNNLQPTKYHKKYFYLFMAAKQNQYFTSAIFYYRIKTRIKLIVAPKVRHVCRPCIGHIIMHAFYASWSIPRWKYARTHPCCWMFNVSITYISISMLINYKTCMCPPQTTPAGTGRRTTHCLTEFGFWEIIHEALECTKLLNGSFLSSFFISLKIH